MDASGDAVKRRWAEAVGALHRLRWILCSAVAAVACLMWREAAGVDGPFFSNAALTFTSDRAVHGRTVDGVVEYAKAPGGFHVFGSLPYEHFGPLTLLVSLPAPDTVGADRWVLIGIDLLLLALTLHQIDRLATIVRPAPARGEEPRLAALVLVAIGGVFAGVKYAHPDVLLVALATAGLTSATVAVRPRAAALWLAVGIASSPAMILALPALFALPTSRARLVCLLEGAALGAVAWAPFFIIEPKTIDAVRSLDPVKASSLLHLLGVATYAQLTWVRPLQTAACALVAVVLVRRRGWPPALVACAATRVLLDPTPFAYLPMGMITAVAVAGVLGRAGGWVASVGTLAVVTEWFGQGGATDAVVRSCLLIAVIAACWSWSGVPEVDMSGFVPACAPSSATTRSPRSGSVVPGA